METVCPSCKNQIQESDFFCPHCGKKLKEPPITLARQIGIYALAFFLPPLGLWPGIKYLLQPDQKAKTVGMTAIILTVISIALSIWLSFGILNQFNQLVSLIQQSQ